MIRIQAQTKVSNPTADEVLSEIEKAEAAFLNWGFIQTEIDLEAELPRLIQQSSSRLQALGLDGEDVAPDSVLRNLEDRRLIYRIASTGRYRTRFAETVRLLYLLRQRFKEQDWNTASRLVSDMRIQLRSRRYPRRDQPASVLLENLRLKDVSQPFLTAVRQLTEGFQLSTFQRLAVEQQHQYLKQTHGERAMVIGAGTGAGKTKAFYIPALAYIAHELSTAGAKQDHRVKVIAIYPATELLKDQLAEALTEAAKITSTPRPIVVGAYYGDTPKGSHFPPDRWVRRAGGHLCPMLTCPQPKDSGPCGGDLIWREEDQKKNAARLVCERCGHAVESDRLLFTREQIRENPPDILFTTTEMLNRMLARGGERNLIGAGEGVIPPRLLLLDEIHTYAGLNGAQIAYLLRRWRHACGYGKHGRNPLSIVGLSATLTEAETFFANLTGIESHHVFYIRPEERDMTIQGMEYNLVLKGDPASNTSLLSTSVQTTMLLGRMLDPLGQSVSEGAFAPKIFGFSDNLDTINRWYRIQDDAEYHKRLSKFRGLDDLPDAQFAAGQDWRLPRWIGYDLTKPLTLERTTSLDRGVSTDAKVVIASRTLEVGFNDRQVGAVVQHKAPRDMASFLQRKGRAGRSPTTRPWMVVVTSAYGRDRYAFQHAETLFEPLLPPLDLPIDNDYIRKIQAAYSTLDWLSKILKRDIDLWSILTKRSRKKGEDAAILHDLKKIVVSVLDGTRAPQLKKWLSAALDIPENSQAFHNLLFGEPRSIIFHLLPTLLRQLEMGWQQLESCETFTLQPEPTSVSPLPDFAPANLFSDLNLPEVQIILPDGYSKGEQTHSLTLGTMFSEFAPGKANERYSQRNARRKHRHDALWLALPEESETSRGKCALDALQIKRDQVPRQVRGANGESISLYRPLALTLQSLPDHLQPSTNAYMIWQSQFSPRSSQAAHQLSLPLFSPWRQVIREIAAHVHSHNTYVETLRLGMGVRVTRVRSDGRREYQELKFTEGEDQPAALGYALVVDALQFTFHPLDAPELFARPVWQTLRPHLRPHYFRHCLNADRRLRDAGLTDFEIEWLWQLEYSMVVAVAVSGQHKRLTLRDAADEVRKNHRRIAERTMRVIFETLTLDNVEHNENGNVVADSKLSQRLLALLDMRLVQDAIADALPALWEEETKEFADWLNGVYNASVGAVVYAALVNFVDDIDENSLAMDLDPDGQTVWVSETTPGGVGIIGRIAESIAARPREFELQLRDTLRHCDRQQLALQLNAVADVVNRKSEDLFAVFDRLRGQHDLKHLAEARADLEHLLKTFGIPPTRDLMVSLNSKFLRPNAERDSDELIGMLAQRWQEETERLDCAIDLRVMAVAANRADDIRLQLQAVFARISGNADPVEEEQTFNTLQSLLWMDCHDSCPECIQYTSRFGNQPLPSRALLRMLLEDNIAAVEFGTEDWEAEVRARLTDQYQVYVTCTPAEITRCKTALLSLLTDPLDLGYQLLYPMIERIEHDEHGWTFALIVREMAGG